MVSAQVKAALISLGITRVNGSWVECLGMTSVQITGSGGSSDGVIATAQVANTAWRLPLIRKVAKPGDSLNVKFFLPAASAVDKSDGSFILPITVKDLNTGTFTTKVLSNTDFGTATDVVSGDFGVPMLYGTTGYVVPAGSEICWGTREQQIAFMSIEDSA